MGRKFPRMKQLYIPDAKQQAVDKAEKIADREGTSLSQLFVEMCENLVRFHDPGNSQQLLENYKNTTDEAYRAPKQCFCGKLAVGEIEAKNGFKGPICEGHLIRGRDAKLFKSKTWKPYE